MTSKYGNYLSRREALDLALRHYSSTTKVDGLLEYADKFYDYANQSVATMKPENDVKSAKPLDEYLEELSDKAKAFGEMRRIKVGDIVRWNHSATRWEVMAKLESENLAWIKSSTSSDYRTVRIDHLQLDA